MVVREREMVTELQPAEPGPARQQRIGGGVAGVSSRGACGDEGGC